MSGNLEDLSFFAEGLGLMVWGFGCRGFRLAFPAPSTASRAASAEVYDFVPDCLRGIPRNRSRKDLKGKMSGTFDRFLKKEEGTVPGLGFRVVEGLGALGCRN